MYVPPFDTTSYSTITQSFLDIWPESRRHSRWKVYSTAEMDKTYVLFRLFISRDRDRDRQQSQQTLEFRRSTTPHVTRIHDQRGWRREPGTFQVTNYPPVISFAINHNATGSLKDTTANLKNGQGFAVNIISEAFVENANSTGVDAPPEFDERALSGLTKQKCVQIRASRVKESAFSMECELYKSIDIMHPVTGEHNSTLILAHVKYFHVRKDMLTSRGAVELTKFKPVARVGDISYARVGDAYRSLHGRRRRRRSRKH